MKRLQRRIGLAALLTCPLGQGCSPLIYEIATQMDSEHMGPAGDTGMPTDPTLPDPTDATDDTGPSSTTDAIPSTSTGPETTGAPPACGDGMHNGDETDLDCGGSCKPCGPGGRCQTPADCAFGDCLDNFCQKAECIGPEDCPPALPCMGSMCTKDGRCAAVPAGDGEPCDDGDACTSAAVCKGGMCVETSQVDCSAFDGPCRAAVCNPNTGNCAVEWLFEGEPCEDGLGCTWFDQCSQGECVGKPPGPLLSTDFSDALGWKADAPWKIGPAMPSQCSLGPAEDPKDDHSPGGDGILAGAAIGGCLPVDAFADVCLESPPVDVMFMPGELRLTYWSVLSSAGAPMKTRVEVFDGKNQQWLPIEVFDKFIAEGDWTEHDLDLTPFKGPALRVRFCHAAADKSQPVGGWSIDDLSIGAPQCP
ncbi:MAG TPA: hypothetical protein VGB85_06975 [Nannocystis sp.]